MTTLTTIHNATPPTTTPMSSHKRNFNHWLPHPAGRKRRCGEFEGRLGLLRLRISSDDHELAHPLWPARPLFRFRHACTLVRTRRTCASVNSTVIENTFNCAVLSWPAVSPFTLLCAATAGLICFARPKLCCHCCCRARSGGDTNQLPPTRLAQLNATTLPNVGMSAAYDLGDPTSVSKLY